MQSGDWSRAVDRGSRRSARFRPAPIVDDEFMELANERIGAIEHAAQNARGLSAALASAQGAGHASAADLRRLRVASSEIGAQVDRLAAITEQMRAALEALAEEEGSGAPSPGVCLMVNQMILSGHSEAEIARVLAGFGVEDPRAVVQEILDSSPA